MVIEAASRMFSKMTLPSKRDRAQLIVDSIDHEDPELTKSLAENGVYDDFVVFIDKEDAKFVTDLVPSSYRRSKPAAAEDVPADEPRNKYKVSVLHLAVKTGNVRKVRTLMVHGADVNEATDDGVTPLILACALNSPAEIVDILLYWDDVQVNARTSWGQTALHYAARSGNRELAVKLMRQLADPHAQDTEGRSPLHVAVEEGNLGLALSLVRFRADPTGIRRSDGATVLQEAVALGHEDIVRAMIIWGVELDVVYRNGELDLEMFDLAEEEREARRLMMERLAGLRKKSDWLSRILIGLRNLVIAGPGDFSFGERSPRDFLDDL